MSKRNTLLNDELSQLKEMATTVRGLSIDAIQKANSGHPGMPMGMADVATLLWMRHLKHNPLNSNWYDRDRFVLSAGHGSMLLYSLLHLTGYNLSLNEIKNFRQWQSKTPGHPEYGHTDGVETTTGPLGQGVANAVGMALAEKNLAENFNKPNHNIINHYTYCIAGDGCLMEGISHEACSLAGHLKLGKLILFYDDNNISIDGKTDLSFSEDVAKRFEAYNWHTQKVDGHDMEAVEKAILHAQNDERPSLIACKTTIGYGSPNKAGTSGVHGSPLGNDELTLTKKTLGLPCDKQFYISSQTSSFCQQTLEHHKKSAGTWDEAFKAYGEAFPALHKELQRRFNGDLTDTWQSYLPDFSQTEAMATRSSSGKVLDSLTSALPELTGGSADLTPSNNTFPKQGKAITDKNSSGNYIHYGVREHAMAAIMNGLALHGAFIPYAGTFMVFSDYMRNSIRLSALMGIRVIYVLTHDSIGLGEDGPTHQPIEHLAALRAIPNLTVVRPADANETAQAWALALKNINGPTAIVLTRQKVQNQNVMGHATAENLQKGAYILSAAQNAQVTLMASGSEVEIAVAVQKQLKSAQINAEVVSMPSMSDFDKQDRAYKNTVLKKGTLKVAIEAGCSQSWYKYVGENHLIFAIDHYGASAPAEEIYQQFGLDAENISTKIIEQLKG